MHRMNVSMRVASFAMATAVAIAAMLAGAGPSAAAPDDKVSPLVVVPEPAKGGPVGCYRVSGTLYGQNRMTFCLTGGGGGNYKVNGDQLACSGGLDWYSGKNWQLSIDLYRAKCGRGQAWSGDSLSCRAEPPKPPTATAKIKGVEIKVPLPGKIAPPAPPYQTLNCTYTPFAGGYRPVQVVAQRI